MDFKRIEKIRHRESSKRRKSICRQTLRSRQYIFSFWLFLKLSVCYYSFNSEPFSSINWGTIRKNEHFHHDRPPLRLELEMTLRYIQMYKPHTPAFKQQGDWKKGYWQRLRESILSISLCILYYFFHSSHVLPLTFLRHILCIRANFTTKTLLQHAFVISRGSVVNIKLIFFPEENEILNLVPSKHSTTFQI